MSADNPYLSPSIQEPAKPAKPRPAPFCGIVSVAVTPVAIAALYGFVLVVNAIIGPPPTNVGHVILLTWLACATLTFVGSIVAAVVRRERRPWLPLVGMATTACIVACFVSAMINDYPD